MERNQIHTYRFKLMRYVSSTGGQIDSPKTSKVCLVWIFASGIENHIIKTKRNECFLTEQSNVENVTITLSKHLSKTPSDQKVNVCSQSLFKTKNPREFLKFGNMVGINVHTHTHTMALLRMLTPSYNHIFYWIFSCLFLWFCRLKQSRYSDSWTSPSTDYQLSFLNVK